MRPTVPVLTVLLAAGVAFAASEAGTAAPAPEPSSESAAGEATPAPAGAQAPAEVGPKRISGMSVLGNQEAPTSLVLVPWKSSAIGDPLGISAMLDDGRQPVDREVFLRALTYYEIRSEGAHPTDAPAGRNR